MNGHNLSYTFQKSALPFKAGSQGGAMGQRLLWPTGLMIPVRMEGGVDMKPSTTPPSLLFRFRVRRETSDSTTRSLLTRTCACLLVLHQHCKWPTLRDFARRKMTRETMSFSGLWFHCTSMLAIIVPWKSLGWMLENVEGSGCGLWYNFIKLTVKILCATTTCSSTAKIFTVWDSL
jgi:hypothetical protein